MNPITLLKEGYGISLWVLIIGIIVYTIVGIWKGWMGIFLITIGNILFVLNRVVIKAEQGDYDDENLKWEDSKK